MNGVSRPIGIFTSRPFPSPQWISPRPSISRAGRSTRRSGAAISCFGLERNIRSSWADVGGTFGPRICQDTTTIRWKRPGAGAKLDQYGIDILLIHRDYVTKEQRDREQWTPVFENYTSAVYLRNTARNADNLQKCAAFCHSRGIPFNARRGFDEHLAYLTNRNWAETMSISPPSPQHG